MNYGHAGWIGNLILPPLGYALIGKWPAAGWTVAVWAALVITGLFLIIPFFFIPLLWIGTTIHGITLVNQPRTES